MRLSSRPPSPPVRTPARPMIQNPPGPIPPPLRGHVRRIRKLAAVRNIVALMLREMSTTYGRSAGGYLWALAEPILGITLLTIILQAGLAIRNPSLGTNFPIFYATGILPFLLYQRTAAKVGTAIPFSRALLHYPAVTFMDTVLARFILSVTTQILIFYIVAGVIMLIWETRTSIDLVPILLSLSMAAGLALGIGMLTCFLFPMYPVTASIWSILTFPLFLISGVFFLYDDMPQVAQDILWYNPLVHVTAMSRAGFYPTYDPVFVSPLYVFAVSGVTGLLGLILLRRNYRLILER